ncbi:hypothetical protein [Microbacterium sp. PRC9]|uniref:ApeA N-terminal domain 1-containing protein n=1 Tax=Microbacterium sp. PRC9 TaxID=2962591 RepID=UPI002882B6C8|nr:hypothetical protein [Microbacterium sp. PRC9]MDT0143227.1 hypothetical protein [Microbacterium sp. PRC9]
MDLDVSVEHLGFGDSLAGLLVDGVESTPYVGATLRLSDTGVEVEIPYLPGFAVDQFAHVDEWFRRMNPQENLLLRTRDGNVMLFGCRWSGHSEAAGSRIGSGRIAPQETLLFERDGALSDPLTVKTCRSRMDGLNRWSRLSAVESEPRRDGNGRSAAVDITVQSPELVEWAQGEATMRIRTTWTSSETSDGYERSHVVANNVVIESEWAEPRPFFDHLVELRRVAHLLIFLFGTALSVREHRVQDESIPARLMGGEVYDHPFVELISARTIRERAQPIPTDKKLGLPHLVLQEVGAEGLARWAAVYDQWDRFILPAVAVIGRRQRFTEDVVMSTSMALEAAGQLIGPRPGEDATYDRARGRPTMATYVYRCLELLGIQWGDYIHSQVGLARAISNNYRRVKHADNGAFPDHVETYLVSVINELVVRLLAANLTGSATDLLGRYRAGSELWTVRQQFETNQVRISDDEGNWVSTAEDDAATNQADQDAEASLPSSNP